MPACILNQSVHSNAICTVVTDPTEAILQATILLREEREVGQNGVMLDTGHIGQTP